MVKTFKTLKTRKNQCEDDDPQAVRLLSNLLIGHGAKAAEALRRITREKECPITMELVEKVMRLIGDDLVRAEHRLKNELNKTKNNNQASPSRVFISIERERIEIADPRSGHCDLARLAPLYDNILSDGRSEEPFELPVPRQKIQKQD